MKGKKLISYWVGFVIYSTDNIKMGKSKSDTGNIFSGIPEPSPWYLKSMTVPIPGCKWERLGTSGKMCLKGNGKPYIIVSFSHYILPLTEKLLLIWHQSFAHTPVNIIVLDIERLNSLGENLEEISRYMDQNKMGMIFKGKPITEVSLNVFPLEEDITFLFPKPISEMKELLILCHSSGISDSQNLALLVAHPQLNTYRLYPQNWFNNGSYDFGYQWPTRVARNPQTGKVHGEGIRIGRFILDNSLKELEKNSV